MATTDEIDDLLNYDPVEDEEEETLVKKTEGDAKKGHYVGLQSSSFKEFMLKAPLLRAIVDCGFEHPSHVQQLCIPQGTLGLDILCQAKAGMGKTAVFVLTTLHLMDFDESATGAIVIVHTRELAFQIQSEFIRFTKYMPEVKCSAFFGGIPLKQNKEIFSKDVPHICVGTPGRMHQLADEGIMKCDKVKHFILDECDTILDDPLMRKKIQEIYLKCPYEKQVMMFSATMPDAVKTVARKFMQESAYELYIDESELVLHGLQQYYLKVTEAEKTSKLTELLDNLEFNQLIIFVSKVRRVKELANLLMESNFPVCMMHGGLKQPERIATYKKFKDMEARIMVATDLLGRGVDIERINVVINYDFAKDTKDYIHRIGRAGRFGTKGLAISFVSNEDDDKALEDVKSNFAVKIEELPDSLDTSSYMEKAE